MQVLCRTPDVEILIGKENLAFEGHKTKDHVKVSSVSSDL